MQRIAPSKASPPQPMTMGQAALFASIRLTGIPQLVAALQRIDDLTLYHTTDHPLSNTTKIPDDLKKYFDRLERGWMKGDKGGD